MPATTAPTHPRKFARQECDFILEWMMKSEKYLRRDLFAIEEFSRKTKYRLSVFEVEEFAYQ